LDLLLKSFTTVLAFYPRTGTRWRTTRGRIPSTTKRAGDIRAKTHPGKKPPANKKNGVLLRGAGFPGMGRYTVFFCFFSRVRGTPRENGNCTEQETGYLPTSLRGTTTPPPHPAKLCLCVFFLSRVYFAVFWRGLVGARLVGCWVSSPKPECRDTEGILSPTRGGTGHFKSKPQAPFTLCPRCVQKSGAKKKPGSSPFLYPYPGNKNAAAPPHPGGPLRLKLLCGFSLEDEIVPFRPKQKKKTKKQKSPHIGGPHLFLLHGARGNPQKRAY